MRRLKLIKVVVPEIVAYFGQGSEPMEPEYECSCGMGVAEEYKCCPYCGAYTAQYMRKIRILMEDKNCGKRKSKVNIWNWGYYDDTCPAQ